MRRAPQGGDARDWCGLERQLQADPDLHGRLIDELTELLELGPRELIKFIIGTAAGKGDIAGLVEDLRAWLAQSGRIH